MLFRLDEGFRSRAVACAVIFVVAIALRLLAIGELGDLPLSRTPQLDSAAYLSWARAIVADWSYWPAYPEHASGYPYFVATVLAMFDSLTAVRVAQAVLGSIGCVLTARVAARTLTPSAFLPAGLLQATYAPLIYLETAILAEALFIFLLTASLDLITGAGRHRYRWLIAGAVLGAAIVVRPTAMVLLPAYAIVAWRSQRERFLSLVGATVAGLSILVAPVVVQNWRVSGLPMVQAYGGMNFYLGNRPTGDGAARARPGGEWDALEGAASRAGSTRNDQDRYYLSRAFEEISVRPIASVQLLGSKLMWTLQDEEIRDTHSYYFFRETMPLLQYLPSFGLLLALAVVGLAVRTPPSRWWLFGYFMAMLLSVVLLVVGTRYRMPLVPALFPFAGAGIAALLERMRLRDFKRAAVLGAMAAAVWGFSEIRTDEPSRNFAEEWALTGLSLLQERKLEESEAAFRTAIGLDESSLAWDGLGLVLQRRELRTSAREAFERAVRINPENATAWVHLGFSYEFLGNGRAAIAAYQKALEITPQRADAQQMLAAALRRYRLQ
ncbi:MAG TPA: glycosyltransferase family 39 protein [Vicinamibacterales bacterium]